MAGPPADARARRAPPRPARGAGRRPAQGRRDHPLMPGPLADPPALRPGALRIIPLGGLGEGGRNMTVFEIDGKLLIVDVGVLFPETEQPGVDLILPDFAPIRDRLGDVLGVVLTHGHEDHIGAVPYLLRLPRGIPPLRRRPPPPFVGGEAT